MHGSTGDIVLLGTQTAQLEEIFHELTHKMNVDLGGSGSNLRTPEACLGQSRCEYACYNTQDMLSFSLDAAEKDFLAQQARRSIEAGLAGIAAAETPQPPEGLGGAKSQLRSPLGAFVTLSLNGALRGCIGNIIGRAPLYAVVWDMGVST